MGILFTFDFPIKLRTPHRLDILGSLNVKEKAMSDTLGNTNWRGYRYAAWAGLLLISLAAIYTFIQGGWQGVAVLVGFGIAAIIFLIMTEQIPAFINFVVVLAALVNAAGYVWNLYDRFWLFDEAVHSYTIFALTLPLGFIAFYAVLDALREHRWQFIFAIASFGIAIGALWEVAEWAFDQIVAGNVIKGKTDTIVDIIIDSIGALLAGWLSVWVSKDRVDGRWRQG
jgi:VanZ family protein